MSNNSNSLSVGNTRLRRFRKKTSLSTPPLSQKSIDEANLEKFLQEIENFDFSLRPEEVRVKQRRWW